MRAIFKESVGFVIGYLILMAPTYFLPYLGSNSAIVGAVGVAVGRGFTPQFWLHLWCLIMLVLVTSIRAKNVGKGWITIFPGLAVFFDLVPVLNLIPLVPTVLHLFALVLGAKGGVPSAAIVATDDANAKDSKAFRWEPWAAGLMTLSAISGSFMFMSGMKSSGKQTQSMTATAPAAPKPGSVNATGYGATTAPARPAASQTTAHGQDGQPGKSAGVETQTSMHSSDVAKAKNNPGPAQLSRAQSPKKVEGKGSVRYIDINN